MSIRQKNQDKGDGSEQKVMNQVSSLGKAKLES